MKTSKRFLALMLSALMIFSVVFIPGADLSSLFSIEAEAAITLGGITQQRVVGSDGSYETIYSEYEDRYFNGNESNRATDFVIPGLAEKDGYIPQGMTYWPEKEWILIASYHPTSKSTNVIFAIDVVTTDFVALFYIYQPDGSAIHQHSGAAVSEHNFYYTINNTSSIAYCPIEEFDVPVGTVKNITLYDSVSLEGEMNGAKTSYCCYDDGVLWTGNFYMPNNSSYSQKANETYGNMLLGYKLCGSNSAEEWAYFSGRYNKEIRITAASGTGSNNGANLTWSAFESRGLVNISGSITPPTAYVGEFCPTFGSFSLVEGKEYTIEFTSTNRSSDLYMFSPAGTHCNVKQSSQTKITDLGNGTYHYAMTFVAGLKPTGADSTWPTTQSTDGTYTGTYTVRFDQDAIQAGEQREFKMTGIRISETPSNQITLTTTSGKATKTNAEMTYNITTANRDSSYTITGTATNTSGAKLELTANYGKLALVEGQTYTMEFTSTNNLTDAYIFAPSGASGTHMRLFPQRGTLGDDGLYHYSTTFTAGRRLEGRSGGDYTWPEKQSTDGSFTGIYTIRFDQDDIQNEETRNFTISNIKVVTTNADFEDTTTPPAGVAGDPTYCVALDDASDQVQYAMVDKGKIYISRSYSRTETTNHIRELAIGDADINAPGNVTITVNGKTRLAHYIADNELVKFGGDTSNDDRKAMLWMGEALCIINDKLYMNAESAAWKYNGGEDTKCSEPIDVIWEIDQYEIMKKKGIEIDRPVEDVKASYYEKVTDVSQLNSDDEYLIVFESPKKDPVTQKNILYALDSFGGYGDNKLPKNNELGDASKTGDSMGIIGYEIFDYSTSTDGNLLYVSDEVDSQKNLRWNINVNDKITSDDYDGDIATVTITNTDLYYATNKYLGMGDKIFSMRTVTQSLYIGRLNGTEEPEDFILTPDGKNFLWCNFEGATNSNGQSCMDFYDNYYKNSKASEGRNWDANYDGLDELEGTFHTAAINDLTTNIMGANIADGSYRYINFYKRVKDEYSSTYDSRVYTDMEAELQADGTYTIDIDSYAISNLQYQKVDERPTDFIFVLDASGSMTNNSDCTGYRRYDGSSGNTLEVDSMIPSGDTEVDHDNDQGKYGYHKTNGKNIFYLSPDGEFYPLYAGFYNQRCNVPWWVQDVTQNYWLYYKNTNNGLYYLLNNDNSIKLADLSESQIINYISTNSNYTSQSTKTSNGDRRKTKLLGEHYEYMSVTRLEALQNAVNQLTYKISREAESTGLDHRIALIQFGSNEGEGYLNTGMYATSSNSMYQYPFSNNTSYQNAFFTTSQFATVRNHINNIRTTQTNPDPDTFVEYGMDMATNTVILSDADYLADGNRSACIIMITDGVPGFGGTDSATANMSANEAIRISHEAKEQGAYVFTVQMGSNSMDGFNMDRYMDYVSSEFIDATSMTNSGDRNIADVEYRIDVPTGSSFNLDSLVDSMFDSVTSNSTNAMVKLDADSILREHVTDAFDISKADITAYKVPAHKDGIGRFYFDYDEAEIDTSVTTAKNGNIVTAKGFNYSANYLHSGGGNMLRLTLTGVVANADAELVNTSINETDTTAIYQTETLMNQNKPFKRFPTENFTIPEYTYVFDYGIKMYDSDINGTLLSVDSMPQKQDINAYKSSLNTDDMGIQFTNKNLDMIYSLKPETTGTEETSRGYCLIQRDDGTYDWFRINVLPASNVYFEEENVTKPTNNGTYTAWTSATNSKSSFMQNLSTVNDVYGYDTAYKADGTGFSYNAAYTSTVAYRSEYLEDKGFAAVDNPNRSDTLSFTYTGDAVDLYGSCGENTGIYIITIKNAETGSVEKVYILDTYFSDSTYYSDGEKINQVPILHHENSIRGTYKVEITSAYLSSVVGKRNAATMSVFSDDEINFYTTDITEQAKEAILVMAEMEDLLEEDIEVIFCDDNSVLNGGTGTGGDSAISTFAGTDLDTSRDFTVLTNYFDGYRIYNPLDNFTVNEYYINSEKGSTYYSIIDSVVSAEDIINSTTSDLTGVAYVEKVIDPEYQPEDTINFANYEKTGPSDELYLINNKAVAFNVRLQNSESKVMISLRAVNGETKAKIGGKENAVTTSNGMYFDVTDYLDIDMTTGIATVTVENSGSNLLAIGDIKLCNAASIAPIMMASLPRIRMMMSAPAEEVEPNTPAEPENNLVIPDPLPIPEEPETEDGTNNNNSNDNSSDSDGIVNIFNDILAEIKSFFDMIIRFFKTLFA